MLETFVFLAPPLPLSKAGLNRYYPFCYALKPVYVFINGLTYDGYLFLQLGMDAQLLADLCRKLFFSCRIILFAQLFKFLEHFLDLGVILGQELNR